ncbi:hypothetical protein [Saccharopolyspora sp. 5N708]|uniref:hypothetical protein n=1 Tax=Saccharopolyspora sp. 5N708 TaxID=3457424 RepID=UPI003FD15937
MVSATPRTHYVDTAGEQGYLKQVFDSFSTAAEHAGVTVIPGLADDGGPGDLIAHLAAERVAQIDELTIADLRKPSGATRGTARSMLSVRQEDHLVYRDGEWVRTSAASRSSIAVPGLSEAVPTIEFALPGVVTIPRHVEVRRVTSVLRDEVAAAFNSITPELVEAMPEGPAEDARRAARWLMAVEVVGDDAQRAAGVAKGVDGYGTTAVIAVEGARRLVVDGAKPGVLAPAQAFDPANFLDFLAPFGVTWSVESR